MNRDILKEQVEARPRITVEPVVYNNRAILEIENSGGMRGEFTAKGRVVIGHPQRELFTMYWESVKDLSCPIDAQGGKASILVAEISESNNLPLRIIKGDILLFKMGTSGEQVFPVASTKEEAITKVIDGVECHGKSYTHQDSCVLEVSLTPAPPLSESFGVRRYSLSADKGWLVFSELTLDTQDCPIESAS